MFGYIHKRDGKPKKRKKSFKYKRLTIHKYRVNNPIEFIKKFCRRKLNIKAQFSYIEKYEFCIEESLAVFGEEVKLYVLNNLKSKKNIKLLNKLTDICYSSGLIFGYEFDEFTFEKSQEFINFKIRERQNFLNNIVTLETT